MLQNAPEFNSVGGGFGGWGGWGGSGIGGLGLVGLVGLNNLFDRRHGGGCDDGCGVTSLDADGIAAKTALLVNQNADQNALLNAIAGNKDQTINEGRALGAAICATNDNIKDAQFSLALQAQNNTQSVKDQATAFAVVNDKRFDDLATQAANNTAAILARINDVENQNLRDQLFEARRNRDVQDIKIENINTNSQLQAQLQAQAQLQTQRDFDNIRRFDSIFGSFNQLNRNTQDVINFGTMAASANQANQQTNVK